MDQPERKRHGPLTWLRGRSRRFWIAAALLPVLYVASIGPVFWLNASGNVPVPLVRSFVWMSSIYHPILWIVARSPKCIEDGFEAYISLWMPAHPMQYRGP